jgi:dUTPase
VTFYATAAGVVPIFAIATIYSSGTFGFRAGHASNPDGILALFIATAVGFAMAELFPMLALSNSGTAFLKSATAIGLIYAGYTMVAATMFAWADRGKEYLEGDRVAQIQLEVKVSKAVLILGTFAVVGTIPILAPAIA